MFTVLHCSDNSRWNLTSLKECLALIQSEPSPLIQSEPYFIRMCFSVYCCKENGRFYFLLHFLLQLQSTDFGTSMVLILSSYISGSDCRKSDMFRWRTITGNCDLKLPLTTMPLKARLMLCNCCKSETGG